jgi:hypothetical protein
MMRVKKAERCAAARSVAVAGLVTAGGAGIRRRLLWIEVNSISFVSSFSLP